MKLTKAEAKHIVDVSNLKTMQKCKVCMRIYKKLHNFSEK